MVLILYRRIKETVLMSIKQKTVHAKCQNSPLTISVICSQVNTEHIR